MFPSTFLTFAYCRRSILTFNFTANQITRNASLINIRREILFIGYCLRLGVKSWPGYFQFLLLWKFLMCPLVQVRVINDISTCSNIAKIISSKFYGKQTHKPILLKCTLCTIQCFCYICHYSKDPYKWMYETSTYTFVYIYSTLG